MFFNCKKLDQKFDKWNISNVKYKYYMFYNCDTLCYQIDRFSILKNNIKNMFLKYKLSK